MATKKEDDLSPAHLDWLMDSRMRIQRSAVKLYRLMEEYEERLKRDDIGTSQALVAAAFSLWRAAFLADKSVMRGDVFKNAKAFLGKIIVDNAISFPTDRTHRDWTFNYYVSNAENRLRFLSGTHPELKGLYSRPAYEKGAKPKPKQRWDACQYALEGALDRLSKTLTGK